MHQHHAHSDHRPGHGGDSLIRWAGRYRLLVRLQGVAGRRWRAHVADRLALRPGNRVLDVASGTGELAYALARRVGPGGRVDGVDAAEEMVAYATRVNRRRGLPVHFATARAQQLPFPDVTFDAVTCTLAWHHIAADEREAALAEMRRVLVPSGRLVVADAQPPPAGLRYWLVRRTFGHVIAERPLDEAVDLMAAAGFDGVTREDTPSAWIGLVTGTRP